MKFSINILLTFAVIILYCLVSSHSSFANTISGQVIAVNDGDTIKIKDSKTNTIYRIRLIGIDALETDYNNLNQGQLAFQARDSLRARLPIGTTVNITPSPFIANDSYGRIIGQVFFNGVDINKEMLEKGLATLYIIYPFDENMTTTYVASTTSAFKSGLGIWNQNQTLSEMPYLFRMRTEGREFFYLIGDLVTRSYYSNTQDGLNNVSPVQRVLFTNKYVAAKSGFTLVR